MSENLTKTSPTNTKYGSVCCVDAGCDTMWSLAQQFAYTRLATSMHGKLYLPTRSSTVDYGQRARTIAATYARFYLELEEHGDPKKKGRYYWMALGAFASKTVACTLDDFRVDYGKFVSENKYFDPGYVRDGLGKGNFWLFQDIAATHWYYSYSPGSFDMCLPTRGENGCHDAVLAILKRLPWSAEALPPLQNLKSSGFIKAGFDLVKKIETEKQKDKRQEKQFEHLMQIAQHEQKVVLQPLIYKDAKFAGWINAQRGLLRWISPALELVFTHACKIGDNALKSVAPEDTVLENYESRMKWIKGAAVSFHDLMKKRTEFMEGEISTMAAWCDAQETK
ncbi:DUF2515 family protein [Deefgea rivuli]|uniref:DUF2515 family protein n=1 Tax=Deefgea rivuli TaxID=400948 RepID=UPI0004883831|nr:hypothetical protein [Deefgea rivuli]